jgi:hypothetical protein
MCYRRQLAIGIVAALALTRLMSSQLFGITLESVPLMGTWRRAISRLLCLMNNLESGPPACWRGPESVTYLLSF